MRLTLPFLGKRAYLQSSTLGQALFSLLTPPGMCELKFIFPIMSNAVELHENPPTPPEDVAAVFRWETESGEWKNCFITVLPHASETLREPFDEEALVNEAVFFENELKLQIHDPKIALPASIALFKHLLLQSQQMEHCGQWVFIRGVFSFVPAAGKVLQIRRRPLLVRTPAIAEAILDGQHWSTIYFAWKSGE